MTTPEHADAPPPTPPSGGEFDGLWCAKCDYDLTGIRSDRCPECGQQLDAAWLRQYLSDTPRPGTAGMNGAGPAPYSDTFFGVMFSPIDVLGSFPRRHTTTDARSYAWSCYLLAWIPLFLVAATFRSFPLGFTAIAGATLGGTVCEVVCAGLLSAVATPRRRGDGFHFWYGIMRYMCGYLALTTTSISLAVAAMNPLIILVNVVICLWWALALGTVVHHHTRPTIARVLAFACIPAGAAAGYFVGGFVVTIGVAA